jgi:gas vesicle protein
MTKGTGKKIAIGTAIAAVAGYVAGILTAPKAGRETRKDIKDTADKGVAEAEKQLKKVHTELDKAIKSAKGQASKLTGKAKDELDEALGKANVAKNKASAILVAVRKHETEDRDLQKALDEATDTFNSLKKYLKKS